VKLGPKMETGTNFATQTSRASQEPIAKLAVCPLLRRTVESRRNFIRTSAGLAFTRTASAQAPTVATVQTSVLDIGYEDRGPRDGFPIILLHGFPDDVRVWDDVAPPLTKAGFRVLAPYLRGHGLTRFREGQPHMAEQAAIGQDVVDFADALGIRQFAVAGYDWGGRAANVVAAIYPERVRAGVFIGGYTIQDVFSPPAPASAEAEHAAWYQWYFNMERGRLGLMKNRREICKLLWQLWSPTWHFTDETFNRTAPSFDNPDFVDAVIHSYRHRHGNAPGEIRFDSMEHKLAERPKITVPAIILYGADDGIAKPPGDNPAERAQYPSLVARRIVTGSGHFLPRQRPDAMSDSLVELLAKR
jgi:pimeloyl-ACP methyl ester carboxylesterase